MLAALPLPASAERDDVVAAMAAAVRVLRGDVRAAVESVGRHVVPTRAWPVELDTAITAAWDRAGLPALRRGSPCRRVLVAHVR